MLVAEHLDFDVARIDDEFFNEDAIITKGAFRFRLGARKTFRDFILAIGNAHAFAAATSRRFDHHRIADLIGDLHRMIGILNHTEITGHGRHFRRIGEFL